MRVIPKEWTSGIWFIKGEVVLWMLPQNFEGIDWAWLKENILERVKRK